MPRRTSKSVSREKEMMKKNPLYMVFVFDEGLNNAIGSRAVARPNRDPREEPQVNHAQRQSAQYVQPTEQVLQAQAQVSLFLLLFSAMCFFG